MTDAIVAQNVGKRYRRYHVDRPGTIHEVMMRGFRKLMPAEHFWGLHEVSFNVGLGRTLGVIGRNGAGKSTLLRLIGGLGRPDAGKIKVRGQVRALLTLGAGFHPELTGRENLFINGIINGLTRSEVMARFDDIVGFAELEDHIDSPLRTFSTGMQMRLGFSIAIHSNPDLLLIDEVLAVGDIAFQEKCLERIQMLKTNGCAIVLVSHDIGSVSSLCEDALWLRAGEVAAYGPARSVTEKYFADAQMHSLTAHLA